jgi:hypothetical protein
MKELGSRLMRAREARGLTLEDAERDTRISRRYLQALEAEQFEAIPAPVYARGFLRSYSQYLGLDAQEMLHLFPRDDLEPVAPVHRASVREPLSAVGPARPTWQKPSPPGRSSQRNGRDHPADREQPYEPVIGIDIGVPSPARKIQTDPAAQARTTTVVVVAIVGVLFIVAIAFFISRAGGGSDTGTTPTASIGTAAGLFPSGTAGAGGSAAAATPSAPASADAKMPDVRNMTLAQARQALQALGVQIKEIHGPNAAPKNTVTDQSPAPDSSLAGVTQVSLAVSDGPQ